MARAAVQRLRGLVPYGRALELQERLAAGLRAAERPAAGGTVGTVLAAKGATVALPRWCYVAGGLGVLALVLTTVATGRRVSRQLDAYEKRV